MSLTALLGLLELSHSKIRQKFFLSDPYGTAAVSVLTLFTSSLDIKNNKKETEDVERKEKLYGRLGNFFTALSLLIFIVSLFLFWKGVGTVKAGLL